MDSSRNQKSVKQIKIYLILRFFKVATLCLFLTSITWNAFPTDLKEFPHMLSTCWQLFLQSARVHISHAQGTKLYLNRHR